MGADGRVTSVVVNYRHDDDTVRCVTSLQASDHLDHHITVIDTTELDDGPASASMRRLASRLDPCVELRSAGGNVGFAAACNLGIQAALDTGSDYVWLVNPDAAVAPDTLSRMLDTAHAHPDAGVIGARVVDGATPARVLFNGGDIDSSRKGWPSHQNAGWLDRDVPDVVVRDVDYVTGACLLLRASAVRDVGLMPEDYFLYFEETDYCLRMRDAGWRRVMAPGARAWHFKRSTGDLPEPYYLYYMCRNRIAFSARFFDATPDECEADMRPFVDNWRARVQRHAPHLVERFDALIVAAYADGRAGRRGPRHDINRFFTASGCQGTG